MALHFKGVILHNMIHSADDIIQTMESIIGKKFDTLTVIKKINEKYCDGSAVFKRKVHNLGFYDDFEEAKQARLKAEKELIGTFLKEHKENIK